MLWADTACVKHWVALKIVLRGSRSRQQGIGGKWGMFMPAFLSVSFSLLLSFKQLG